MLQAVSVEGGGINISLSPTAEEKPPHKQNRGSGWGRRPSRDWLAMRSGWVMLVCSFLVYVLRFELHGERWSREGDVYRERDTTVLAAGTHSVICGSITGRSHGGRLQLSRRGDSAPRESADNRRCRWLPADLWVNQCSAARRRYLLLSRSGQRACRSLREGSSEPHMERRSHFIAFKTFHNGGQSVLRRLNDRLVLK